MTGDPNLGALQIWLMGFAVVMFLPVLIAIGFSLWAATRPSHAVAAMTHAALRLWRQHEPGGHAEIRAGRPRARRGRARRPSLCHHRRRLCLGRAVRAAQTVHGVLWRITPRDRVMLDAWENVGGGLYRAETWRCAARAGARPALVYFARPGAEGRPKPGYIELVIAAAREWDLPAAYIRCAGRPGGGAPARRGRAQDRRIPVTRDPPRRVPRPGAGRRASAPSSRTRRRGPASRAGCATAATARSKRCSPATPRPSRTRSRLAARAPTPPASTASRRATARADELALRGDQDRFAVLPTV